jgi:hypothetical protein
MGMWGRVVASGIISVFDQMEFFSAGCSSGKPSFFPELKRDSLYGAQIKHAVIPASSKRKRIFD